MPAAQGGGLSTELDGWQQTIRFADSQEKIR
jgi:hypothetical protein